MRWPARFGVLSRSVRVGLVIVGLICSSVFGEEQFVVEDARGIHPLNAVEPNPALRSEFLYQQAPFPEVHASTIVETPHGIVVAFFGGTEEKNDDVCVWITRQVDGHWTPVTKVADGVQHSRLRYPCWNPVLFQQPGGSLQLFYKVGPDPQSWWGMLTESTDGGVTWSWPHRLPATIDGPVKNKPVLLQDGTLLCGSSTEHNDEWLVHFELTRDSGRTWERVGPVHSKEQFGAIQPTILIHPNGHLQALSRSRQNRITSVTSLDGGRTWSPMTTTDLPNPNSGIDAVTLANGTHLLVYNHTVRNSGQPRGRGLLNVALSDDGVTWDAAYVLENSPHEYSYPAVIQTSDGMAHVIYTWRRQTVKHVVLDVQKLKHERIVNGVWPGYPDAGK